MISHLLQLDKNLYGLLPFQVFIFLFHTFTRTEKFLLKSPLPFEGYFLTSKSKILVLKGDHILTNLTNRWLVGAEFFSESAVENEKMSSLCCPTRHTGLKIFFVCLRIQHFKALKRLIRTSLLAKTIWRNRDEKVTALKSIEDIKDKYLAEYSLHRKTDWIVYDI